MQNCLDLATHLAASHGRDVPDYATAIDELGRLGIVPAEFARSFRAIAGFRNILVHAYLAVDVARLHDVLNQRLDDFEQFATLIEGHVAA